MTIFEIHIANFYSFNLMICDYNLVIIKYNECMLYEVYPRDLIDNECGQRISATEKEGHLQPLQDIQLIE